MILFLQPAARPGEGADVENKCHTPGGVTANGALTGFG